MLIGLVLVSCSKEELMIENSENTSMHVVDQPVSTLKWDYPLLTMTMNDLDARYQREFRQKYYEPCGGTRFQGEGDRKFVQELYTEVENGPNNTKLHKLYLRLKLEWKGSHYWNAASEHTTVSVDIDGSVNFNGEEINIDIDETIDECRAFNQIELASVTTQGPFHYFVSFPVWEISIGGEITQQINGDVAENKWINNAAW